MEVRKHKLISISPDGNPHHLAQVNGYIIKLSNTTSPVMTLDDLKELRRVIRRAIRNESH